MPPRKKRLHEIHTDPPTRCLPQQYLLSLSTIPGLTPTPSRTAFWSYFHPRRSSQVFGRDFWSWICQGRRKSLCCAVKLCLGVSHCEAPCKSALLLRQCDLSLAVSWVQVSGFVLFACLLEAVPRSTIGCFFEFLGDSGPRDSDMPGLRTTNGECPNIFKRCL